VLRGTFPVKENGANPLVIVEVTSPSTRYVDLDEKVEDYHKAGVPLYIIADRRETNDGSAFIRLLAYRTTPEGYVRVPDDPKGVWIEALKVWVQAEGDLVVCADEHGNRIPDLRTQRDTAEKEREAERTARATAEKERDAEQAARLAAEQKLKELYGEFKRLRGDTN
jgi:colicin import membrane protein